MTLSDADRRYNQMQQRYYRNIPASEHMQAAHVVGMFEEHEKYPYEEFLLKKFHTEDLTRMMLALDFGCGPGRMIRRLASTFGRVDGVDLSPNSIEVADRYCVGLENRPKLFINDGIDLAGIPDNEYDFVYSTIAFHHIASYEIRLNLLREFFRVMRRGARLAIQLFYTTTPRDQWMQHADWRESRDDAPMTNGYHDVRITPDNIPLVRADLEAIGFNEFDHMLAPYPPPPHPKGPSETDWVFIYARKP